MIIDTHMYLMIFEENSIIWKKSHMLAFFWSSISLSLSLCAIMCWFLIPMTPVLQFLLSASLSLKAALKFLVRVSRSW